jgi:digeranylgeranylglycerophospholipid reductase
MITIIGAGPIGNYLAYLLAKNKKQVHVFEEHINIGSPVQCTGITTNKLNEIIRLNDDIIINKINKARIYAPNKKFIEINFKNPNLILDRNQLDNHLADLAKKEGVIFKTNHKLININKENLIIQNKNNGQKEEIKSDHIVGADGPLSQIQYYITKRKNKVWQGIQAKVKMNNKNIVEFYPYFGTYAWVVPENKKIARVGLVGDNRYTNLLFKNFLKFKEIKKEQILEYQGGLIPQYNPKIKTQLKQKGSTIYIVGDAATQVKATTGGGIIQGLLAAAALSKSITKNKNYHKQWRKSIGKELYIHLKARKIMDKFKDKDWNKLINMINSPECKDILSKTDRDDIYSIIIKLIIRKPSLLRFVKYIF